MKSTMIDKIIKIPIDKIHISMLTLYSSLDGTHLASMFPL